MNSPGNWENTPTTQAIEIAIRLSLIFFIMAWCLQILTPFVGVVAWGAIIAVAIYTPFLKLVDKLGGRKKLAVTLIAVLGITIILVPVYFLADSMVEGATRLGGDIISGEVTVPPPSEAVKEWPVIGERTYDAWHQASVNLMAFLEKHNDQLAAVGKKMLSTAAGVGMGVLQFIVSTLIAAVFLTSAESVGIAMRKLACRLSENHGEELLAMSSSTIRSVAVGVIGIAFIQAMLGGVGMLLAGVPAAGLLAGIILILAIAQLPPILVLGPVAAYVFSVESTTVALVFLVWSLAVSFSDALLKPLLLGRGVDVPMLVILLGAIGGMITGGIVGLFIGAVILAVGYSLFRVWVDQGTSPAEEEQASPAE